MTTNEGSRLHAWQIGGRSNELTTTPHNEPSEPNSRLDHDLLTPRLSPAELLLIDQQERLVMARLFDAKPAELGRYLLREKIGEGGMGVVYAAYDPKLQRKVALKLLSVDHPDLRRRFIREARAMARLSHPNAVEIHEVGEFHEQAFIAMEYIEGPTLRAWLSAEPRTSAEILAVFVAAGRGLAAAHERGLVHRDFKPANVMIDQRGRVRVMDFGVARFEAEVMSDEQLRALGNPHSSVLTRPGMLIGTPSYMAPEQANGEHTDARSDQFSFCVSLYEAFFGERPFVCASGETPRYCDLDPAGALPGTRPSDLTTATELALLRGLALDPAHRFATMDDLLAALQRGHDRRKAPHRRIPIPIPISISIQAIAIALPLALLVVAGFVIHGLVEGKEAQRLDFVQRSLESKLDGAHGRIESILLRPTETTLFTVINLANSGRLDRPDPKQVHLDELFPSLAGSERRSITTLDMTGRGCTLRRLAKGWQTTCFVAGRATELANWTTTQTFAGYTPLTGVAGVDDLRRQSWYLEASHRRHQSGAPFVWSLPESSELAGPGLWVSAPTASGDREFVVAVEIDLSQLMALTAELSVGGTRYFAFDGRDRVLGLPITQDPSLLESMLTVDDEFVRAAFSTWRTLGDPSTAFRFEVAGVFHWAEIRKLDDNAPIWVGVVSPESSFDRVEEKSP